MHEYVYADRILQTVLEEVGTHRKPSLVEVEVGEMLGLTKASLGTACDYRGRLPVKRHEHRIGPTFSCPKCGSSLQVEAGPEVRLIGNK